jgi:CRP-like cAMP-binding protein
LLKAGDVCRYVYYIASGCLQVYVHDEDDNENTRDLVTEDNWCSELMSFGQQKPATENIRTVEDCTLLSIDHHNFGTLLQQVPQFDKVYRQILEQSYANSVYRINTFVSMSALDRIKWLMQYRPGLLTRLPAKLVASYLGINKDVFSRLRSQI